MAKLISALSLAACLIAGVAYGLPDVSSIARAVDEHYNHLQTLQADFTEIYQGAGVDGSTVLLRRSCLLAMGRRLGFICLMKSKRASHR